MLIGEATEKSPVRFLTGTKPAMTPNSSFIKLRSYGVLSQNRFSPCWISYILMFFNKQVNTSIRNKNS